MENEKKIEIDVPLTFNDFWRMNLWYLVTRRIITIVGIVILIAVIAISLSNGIIKGYNPDYLSAFGLIAFVPFVLCYVAYKNAKNASNAVKGSYRYVFSLEGIEFFSQTASSQILWIDLVKVVESRTDFLLFPQPQISYLIPKRAFESESQINDFREMLRSALGDKAKLTK
ncbi:MAG: YcxB family protein [Pyrinomonadaceae bacterium]|nr:YcxB family protein [Pyrinomonadaceae bacterium]